MTVAAEAEVEQVAAREDELVEAGRRRISGEHDVVAVGGRAGMVVLVGLGAALELIVAGAADQRVVAAVALERVGAAVAVDAVVAREAVEAVGRARQDHGVVAGRALGVQLEGHRALVAEEHQALDIDEDILAVVAVHGGLEVGDGGAVLAVELDQVVVDLAGELDHVETVAAVDRIVAGEADERIVAAHAP